MTKKTPGASTDEIDESAILLRAYGNNTEILIDRDREAKSHALLAQRRLAPPLLARFENGLLYRFIQGRVCTAQDLTSEPIWRAVARRLGEWHGSLPINAVASAEPKTNGNRVVDGVKDQECGLENGDSGIAQRTPAPNIWQVMLKWVNALPASTEADAKRKEDLREELERSYNDLDSSHGLGQDGMIFGHCDLLSANVIVLPPSGTNGIKANGAKIEEVSFIDYEYATPCPAAFDIANHFAEWGGYDCDYTMLPTRSVRRAFLAGYLDSFSTHSSETVDDGMLDPLATEVDRYRGMPGFYWGIWALIQKTISQIDFDYASYAEVRLGEYFAWREEDDGIRKRTGKEMPLRERRWAQED